MLGREGGILNYLILGLRFRLSYFVQARQHKNAWKIGPSKERPIKMGPVKVGLGHMFRVRTVNKMGTLFTHWIGTKPSFKWVTVLGLEGSKTPTLGFLFCFYFLLIIEKALPYFHFIILIFMVSYLNILKIRNIIKIIWLLNFFFSFIFLFYIFINNWKNDTYFLFHFLFSQFHIQIFKNKKKN